MEFNSIWERLTGGPSDFLQENRMVNAISVFTLFILIAFFHINLSLGFYEIATIISVLILLQAFFYYLSRFRKIYKVTYPAYGIVTYLTLITLYYYNGGINGPTMFIFFMTFIVLIAFTPRKMHMVWVLLHITVALVLLHNEYTNPGAVISVYDSRNARFIDIGVTYIFTLAFIYFATVYLRNLLGNEKNIANKRAEEIENYNVQILQQNAALEKTNQEKNKLFSIVSHDLRSPLNTIKSYLELLSAQGLEENQKNSVEKELLSITNNTSDMLSNLLEWSKAQMDGVTVNLKQVSLSEILRNTLDVQKDIARKKGVHFAVSISADLNVLADTDMLQLVMRNLINNAVKFTPAGGEVSIHADRKLDDCRIMVKDTGRGIDPEQQKEMFSLKTNSTYGTMNEKGVGLGLMLCKEYVELQSGKIWFISSVNVGSTFYVSLPLA